jgi:hypothetical protein
MRGTRAVNVNTEKRRFPSAGSPNPSDRVQHDHGSSRMRRMGTD